jgi:hypothetical protein
VAPDPASVGGSFIIAHTLTDQDTGDASRVVPLLDQIGRPIEQFTADGAYDGKPPTTLSSTTAPMPPSSFRRVASQSNRSMIDLPAKGICISPQSKERAG